MMVHHTYSAAILNCIIHLHKYNFGLFPVNTVKRLLRMIEAHALERRKERIQLRYLVQQFNLFWQTHLFACNNKNDEVICFNHNIRTESREM